MIRNHTRAVSNLLMVGGVILAAVNLFADWRSLPVVAVAVTMSVVGTWLGIRKTNRDARARVDACVAEWDRLAEQREHARTRGEFTLEFQSTYKERRHGDIAVRAVGRILKTGVSVDAVEGGSDGVMADNVIILAKGTGYVQALTAAQAAADETDYPVTVYECTDGKYTSDIVQPKGVRP